MEWKAKFQWEIRENKIVILFPSKFTDLLDPVLRKCGSTWRIKLSLIAINIWKTLDSEFGSYDLFLSDNIKINEGQEQAYRQYFSCVRISCIVVYLTFSRLMTYIYVVPHRQPPDVAFYIFIQQIYVLNSLIIIQPTNALIVCHFFLNHFLKHFHCSYMFR